MGLAIVTLKQGDIRSISELESELRHIRGTLDHVLDSQIKQYLRDFLIAISEQVEQRQLSRDDPRYEHYLTEFISETPRSAPTKSALELAESGTDEDDIDIRFAAHFTAVLCALQNPHNDFKDLVGIFEDFCDEFDEPILDHLKSRVYRRGFTTEHYETAILAGVAAAEQVRKNEFVYSNLAGAIVDFVYSTSEIEIDSEKVPSERDELLAFAHEYAQKAIYSAEDEPQLHSVFGDVLLLQERYDEAEEQLQKAIRKELDTWSGRVLGGVASTDDFRQQLRNIRQSRRQAERTQQALEKVQSDLTDFEDRLDKAREEFDREVESTRDDFEQSVVKYRDQSLQFIGFFAAIVTAVLVSAQVVTNVESFALASRLILVLIGGLLTSFSGLGMVLEREFSIYNISSAVIGLILALGGWVLPLIQ